MRLLATNQKPVNDRIEEYRRDWHSGPTQARPKARKARFYRRRPWLTASLLSLLAIFVAGWFHGAVPGLERQFVTQVNRTKTELEVSAGLRELRRYYLANGALPPAAEDYLRSALPANKKFPPGFDFWGTPYRVDNYWDGFGVRSAGPNRRFDDRDDIARSVEYRVLAPR